MPSSPGYTVFGPDFVKDDWQYIDGLETITFYIRTSDAIPTTGGLTVPNCLFRARSQVLDNFLDTKEVPLHIWRTQIPNGLVTFTADMIAGSPVLRNCMVVSSEPADGGLIAGQFLRATGIRLQTWIMSANGGEVMMSQAATETDTGVTIVAAVIPKQNDVAVDIDGYRWIATRSDIQTFSTRFRLPMLLSRSKV